MRTVGKTMIDRLRALAHENQLAADSNSQMAQLLEDNPALLLAAAEEKGKP